MAKDNDERELWWIDHAAAAPWGEQVDGTALENVHPASVCAGQACVLHNPSEHHMRAWPLNWRDDRKIMERFCPHGIGHPDPDDAAYLVSVGRIDKGIHGCDGCCRP